MLNVSNRSRIRRRAESFRLLPFAQKSEPDLARMRNSAIISSGSMTSNKRAQTDRLSKSLDMPLCSDMGFYANDLLFEPTVVTSNQTGRSPPLMVRCACVCRLKVRTSRKSPPNNVKYRK